MLYTTNVVEQIFVFLPAPLQNIVFLERHGRICIDTVALAVANNNNLFRSSRHSDEDAE